MSQAGRFSMGSGGLVVETLTGNTGGPVGPDGSFNINVLGDTTTVNVAGNPGTNTLTISATGSVPISFPTDVGTATPALGVLNIFSGGLGRATPDTATRGSGNTVDVDLRNVITLGDLSVVTSGNDAITLVSGDLTLSGTGVNAAGNINIPNTTSDTRQGVIKFGGDNTFHNYGTQNIFIGKNAGNETLNTGSSVSNNALGTIALQSLTTGGGNTGIGNAAGAAITSGIFNTCIGSNACSSDGVQGLNSGSENVAIGSLALAGAGALTGSYNIAIGYASGSFFNGAEHGNVLINCQGMAGENNTLRIGNATGIGNQDLQGAYICGINGVNVGAVASVVSIFGDHLGTTTLTAGTGITITPGVNTITIAASGTSTFTYTSVNHAASPYTVLSTDEYLGCDVTAGVISILLPNAPSTGRTYTIKDKAGLAATSNITVTTVGGAVNIDGATTFVMNTNYEAINVIFNGTSYEVW